MFSSLWRPQKTNILMNFEHNVLIFGSTSQGWILNKKSLFNLKLCSKAIGDSSCLISVFITFSPQASINSYPDPKPLHSYRSQLPAAYIYKPVMKIEQRTWFSSPPVRESQKSENVLLLAVMFISANSSWRRIGSYLFLAGIQIVLSAAQILQ